MNLTSKLTSLQKERDEQIKIEEKAHARIIELNRLIKSAERLIKDAEEVFKDEDGVCKAEAPSIEEMKMEAEFNSLPLIRK